MHGLALIFAVTQLTKKKYCRANPRLLGCLTLVKVVLRFWLPPF